MRQAIRARLSQAMLHLISQVESPDGPPWALFVCAVLTNQVARNLLACQSSNRDSSRRIASYFCVLYSLLNEEREHFDFDLLWTACNVACAINPLLAVPALIVRFPLFIQPLNQPVRILQLRVVVGPNNTWCHILLHPQKFRGLFSLPYISVNFVDRDRIDRVHSDCIRTRWHDRQGAICSCCQVSGGVRISKEKPYKILLLARQRLPYTPSSPVSA